MLPPAINDNAFSFAAESSHSGQQRGELLWDRERERLKRKEKERESGAQHQAMMAVVASSSAGASGSAGPSGGKSQEEIDMMSGKSFHLLPEEFKNFITFSISVMGFGNFDTTKNKKVKGNQVGDVNILVKRKYRQYMNRKGGFNRPLDYVH